MSLLFNPIMQYFYDDVLNQISCLRGMIGFDNIESVINTHTCELCPHGLK